MWSQFCTVKVCVKSEFDLSLLFLIPSQNIYLKILQIQVKGWQKYYVCVKGYIYIYPYLFCLRLFLFFKEKQRRFSFMLKLTRGVICRSKTYDRKQQIAPYLLSSFSGLSVNQVKPLIAALYAESFTAESWIWAQSICQLKASAPPVINRPLRFGFFFSCFVPHSVSGTVVYKRPDTAVKSSSWSILIRL